MKLKFKVCQKTSVRKSRAGCSLDLSIKKGAIRNNEEKLNSVSACEAKYRSVFARHSPFIIPTYVRQSYQFQPPITDFSWLDWSKLAREEKLQFPSIINLHTFLKVHFLPNTNSRQQNDNKLIVYLFSISFIHHSRTTSTNSNANSELTTPDTVYG